MKVLTEKEYMESKKGEMNFSPIDFPEEIGQNEEVIANNVEYFLFHPDGYINGDYLVSFSNRDYVLKIKSGVVKTTMKEIRDILLKQNFIFIKEVDYGNIKTR